MTVYCVFMQISVVDGTELRLLAIFDTKDRADLFLQQYDNPLVPLVIQQWDVIDTVE